MKITHLLTALILLAFGCQNDSKDKDSSASKPEMKSEMSAPKTKLDKLFEEVNVVKMHLFATEDASPSADDYPYVGMAIPKEMNQYLDEKLNSEAGTVYACYRTENSGHYILRVPGKYVSGDLALAKWDDISEKLVKVSHLAYKWCDEGTCNQQDAWLSDLDDDRDLELIVQERQIDQNGNISTETFNVSTDNGKGEFLPAEKALTELAVKDRYVMMN